MNAPEHTHFGDNCFLGEIPVRMCLLLRTEVTVAANRVRFGKFSKDRGPKDVAHEPIPSRRIVVLLMTDLFSPPLPTRSTDKIHWGSLRGSASALAAAQAGLAHNHTSLVIVPTMAEADRLEHDIKLFLENVPNAPAVLHFADWETLPYDNFSPHQDIVSARMRTLFQLSQGQKSLVVVSAPTLAQRLPPKEYIIGNSLMVKLDQQLDLAKFRSQLTAAGYNNVDTVYQHGEFAIRGSLLDVYPMGSNWAFRIELFDDSVESLREFDPETQRTVRQVEAIELLPARECPLDKEGISHFKLAWHEHFDVDHRASPLYQDVSDGISPAGVEYYLPLFFSETATLFDYLPEASLVMVTEGLEQAIENFWREANSRYESRRGDRERPILPPQAVFQPVDEVFRHLKSYPRITLHPTALPEKQGNFNFATEEPPALYIDAKAKNPLEKLERFTYGTDLRLLFCAESTGRREALREHLAKIGVFPEDHDSFASFLVSGDTHGIAIADLEQGLVLPEQGIALIAEPQLFGMQVQQRRRRKPSSTDHEENVVKNLSELKIGAPVVHIDHGVGRYRGLEAIEIEQQADEFLVIEYADQAKLYVPVSNLHLISRYTGADEAVAPLHRLGSEQWQKAKRKAAEQIRDVAAELLDIYARRKARRGTAFDDPGDAYRQFAASFPFEETADQEQAITAVRADMLAPQPMDRLICGDVGFGKTEVAMRAAFIAVQNDRQVVVLVPTTLLAQQHYESFRDRFADWPVNIEVISRFRSSKDVERIQENLEKGKTDIIIGTHKLLQGDLKYPNLGLVIIDEEHRFGVRQKEALKALRAEVDVLAMTATPIPRTLNMAMSGIRDLSIIATPPAKRLSIKTFVREGDDNLKKEAILREILRGGQVYFLHNEVKTIERAAEEITNLIPEARVRIGHGQMRERELEATMSDFYHKRFNVLVCTTIIETGIDVPSANTIIIERADKFGLAQLHQLRGRVGRSHHQAYAYLLTAPKRNMTADAHKRLLAISEAQDLGAGFTLASHDLEIRGAGELLGEEQSGQMQAIGFSLYMEMLDRAVKAMQEGKTLNLDEPLQTGVDINLRIPALIPEDYLPDVHLRLIMYKRLASAPSEDALDELQVEMIDRFGLLPPQVKNLVRVTQLRLRAERLGIAKVEAGRETGRIEFSPNTQVEPLTLVTMVQTQPQKYRLEGANHLKFTLESQDAEQRIQSVHQLLEKLSA
jgi:transcription-repair coupling factor (superfamily II helicase)